MSGIGPFILVFCLARKMISSNTQQRIDELRQAISDPSRKAELIELIKLLSERAESRSEVRERCFRALNTDPKNAVLRLLLARSYYLDGLGEFCVRELVELQKYTSTPSLEKLLSAFGGFVRPFMQGVKQGATSNSNKGPSSGEEESVVAEIDLEADFANTIDEITKD